MIDNDNKRLRRLDTTINQTTHYKYIISHQDNIPGLKNSFLNLKNRKTPNDNQYILLKNVKKIF